MKLASAHREAKNCGSHGGKANGGGQRLGGLETGWLLGDRIQLDRRAGVQYSTVPQGNHGGGQLIVCFEEATREDLGPPRAVITIYLR